MGSLGRRSVGIGLRFRIREINREERNRGINGTKSKIPCCPKPQKPPFK